MPTPGQPTTPGPVSAHAEARSLRSTGVRRLRQGLAGPGCDVVGGEERTARDRRDLGERFRGAVGVVVDRDHLMATVKQLDADVAADESGSAGYANRRRAIRVGRPARTDPLPAFTIQVLPLHI